jgi:hypothetical protein
LRQASRPFAQDQRALALSHVAEFDEQLGPGPRCIAVKRIFQRQIRRCRRQIGRWLLEMRHDLGQAVHSLRHAASRAGVIHLLGRDTQVAQFAHGVERLEVF